MAKSKSDSGDEKLSKRKMVQYSIDELGADATPKELQSHIETKYGTTISAQMLSSYKSNILKKSGNSGRSSAAGSVGGSVAMKDITTLRDLIDRLGASQLTTLVKVLSK